jgi:hypothetical protein
MSEGPLRALRPQGCIYTWEELHRTSARQLSQASKNPFLGIRTHICISGATRDKFYAKFEVPIGESSAVDHLSGLLHSFGWEDDGILGFLDELKDKRDMFVL